MSVCRRIDEKNESRQIRRNVLEREDTWLVN
jgi:hypothetical protein